MLGYDAAGNGRRSCEEYTHAYKMHAQQRNLNRDPGMEQPPQQASDEVVKSKSLPPPAPSVSQLSTQPSTQPPAQPQRSPQASIQPQRSPQSHQSQPPTPHSAHSQQPGTPSAPQQIPLLLCPHSPLPSTQAEIQRCAHKASRRFFLDTRAVGRRTARFRLTLAPQAHRQPLPEECAHRPGPSIGEPSAPVHA